MRSRQLLILFIVFLLLAGIFALRKAVFVRKIDTAEYERLEISLDASEVNGIKIEKPGKEKVLLEKKDNSWVVVSCWGMKAKENRITELLEELAGLTGELRSNSEELLGDFAVTNERAFRVTLFDKESVMERFLVGAKKPGLNGSFLRKADSRAVYLVGANILSLMGIYGDPEQSEPRQDFWVDMKVFPITPGEVNSVQVVKIIGLDSITTLFLKKETDPEKEERHWTVIGNEPAFAIAGGKVDDHLERLKAMFAVETADPQGTGYGFEEPFLTMILGTEDGKIELILGDEKGDSDRGRYARTADGFVYVIPGYMLRELDVDVSRFFADNPLRIDRDNLKSMSIRAKSKTTFLDESLLGQNEEYLENLKNLWIEKQLVKGQYREKLIKKPDYELRVAYKDDSELILFGKEENEEKKEESRFLIWDEDGKNVFQLSEIIFNNIFARDQRLKRIELRTEN